MPLIRNWAKFHAEFNLKFTVYLVRSVMCACVPYGNMYVRQQFNCDLFFIVRKMDGSFFAQRFMIEPSRHQHGIFAYRRTFQFTLDFGRLPANGEVLFPIHLINIFRLGQCPKVSKTTNNEKNNKNIYRNTYQKTHKNESLMPHICV